MEAIMARETVKLKVSLWRGINEMNKGELAEAMGVSRATAGSLDRQEQIRFETLRRFFDAVGITPEHKIGEVFQFITIPDSDNGDG